MITPKGPEEAASGTDVLAGGVSLGLPDAGWVQRMVTAARRSPGFGSHLAIAMLLAALLGIGLRTGIVPIRSYDADILCFVANGWRILWGQRPYADFSTALGPVVYLLPALGIKLAGGNLNGLGYGTALAGVAIGIWGYTLLVRRVSGLLAVAGAAMLCLLAMAQVQLGESFRLSTVAMSYNRQGYALLGLLIVEAFPLREAEQTRGVAGALSTGAICAILLFLKANYFLVGLVLAAISLVWSGRLEHRRLFAMAAGFTVVALAFLAYVRFDVGAMLADLRMAASGRGGAVSLASLRQAFAGNFPGFLVLAGLALLVQMGGRPPADGGWLARLLRLRPLALAGIVYCGGVLLLATNCQLERLPLHELLALLFLDSILQSSRLDTRHTAGLAAITIGLILGTQAPDGLALLNGLRLKLHPPREFAYHVTSGGFAGAVFLDDNLENRGTHRAYGNFLATYLNDGRDLLLRELLPGEKVTTMDTYNPFPYALGIEPPHGGNYGVQYHVSFSDRFHQSADAFFGTADVVMYPKEHEQADANWPGLEIYYIPEMERRFVQVAESAQWRMYRRRK